MVKASTNKMSPFVVAANWVTPQRSPQHTRQAHKWLGKRRGQKTLCAMAISGLGLEGYF